MVGNGRNTLFWYDCWVGKMPLNLKFSRLFDLAVFKECSVEEMSTLGWTEGGGVWVWRRRLLAWEEESVRECSFLLHNIVLQDTVSDNWRWLLDPIHGYSVREAYLITHSSDMVDRTFVDDVWHKHIPSKVSLLVWRLLRNRLPTKDDLVRRGVLHANDITCGAAGCDSNETISHLFLSCDNYYEVRSNVWNWLGISSVTSVDLRQHFMQFTLMGGTPRASHLFLRAIWFATIWVIWKERNNHIFQNTASTSATLIEKVKLNSFLWLKSKQASFCYNYTDGWRHPLLCMGV